MPYRARHTTQANLLRRSGPASGTKGSSRTGQRRTLIIFVTVSSVLTASTAAILTNYATDAPPAWAGNPWLVWPAWVISNMIMAAFAVYIRMEKIGTNTSRRATPQSLTLLLRECCRDGRLPRLSELPDEILGPTPTIYTKAGRAPYVDRPAADATLRSLLEVKNPPFPYVIVVGPSKAGKSRTALEAARKALKDAPTILPLHGIALAKFSRLDPPIALGDLPALVWMDDITVADLDHFTGDVLDSLRGRCILLGTMRDRSWDEIYYADSEITAVSRAALRRARKCELPFELTPAERVQAAILYPTEALSLECPAPASIAETLVGGERLWSRYCAGREACPAGHAIVQAAVDWQRGGLVRPCPESDPRGTVSYISQATAHRSRSHKGGVQFWPSVGNGAFRVSSGAFERWWFRRSRQILDCF